MKISSIYKAKASKGKPVFSLEVFPPKKTSSIDSIYSTLDGICVLSPDFISVTYGAGGNVADFKTRSIAEIIKKEYGIESMAHLTCVSTSRGEAGSILSDFEAHSIENVLALRGDINPEHPAKKDFEHASDLASFISDYGSFDIGGACYPEVHAEAASPEADVENLKIKVDSGVSFLISQLFFDNSAFMRFIERVRASGITVPVSAGIMPVTNAKQIERMVTMCGASIPNPLSKLMAKYADLPDDLAAAGIEYAASQIAELADFGVDGIHIYTMNNPAVALSIYNKVRPVL